MLTTIDALADRRRIVVEMMYRPRLTASPAQIIFDYALRSRLRALDPATDAVLISVNSPVTLDSLMPILGEFPALTIATQIVNPPLYSGISNTTPSACGWPTPDQWTRYQYSDRWARLAAAFVLADRLPAHSALIFPAHDAIWGNRLLDRLSAWSTRYARDGRSAAISPLSFYRQSAVPGASIPAAMIDLTNVAFNRDPLFAFRLRQGTMQGFWGKTGLIPVHVCTALRSVVDRTFLEDDSEIDRAIRVTGGISRAVWIRDPKMYRQALPIFTEADLRRVIERTLHYSLPAGNSYLLAAPDRALRAVIALNPRYRRCWTRAARIIAEANAAIVARVDRYGASWFDWGAYRYVVRVGDPEAEVWRLADSSTGAAS